MLRCAHKELLILLAREHERWTRHAWTMARLQLGEDHPNVIKLAQDVELANDTLRAITESVQAAA